MSVGEEIARETLRAADEGPPVAVATVLRAPDGATAEPGAKLLVRRDGSRLGGVGGGALEDAVARDCLAALTRLPRSNAEAWFYRLDGTRTDRMQAGSDAIEVMIEVTEPPAALIVVGGGHVGQALAAIAALAGFSVTVLDDRDAFANAERFPTADRVVCGDVVAELRRLSIDSSTYVVCVSRGHKLDEIALREVISRGAGYVGMIGSMRRVSTVLTHLAREGCSREDLERVHTPIGLDIGAETPEEIAVSIVAEMIAVRRGGTGQRLSEVRKARIRD
jgi:xanthine dehydrogenase accessory factor